MRGIRAFAIGLTVVGALSAVIFAPACGPDPNPQDSSQTHFLSACEAGCTNGLTCICGVCSRPCSTSNECSSLASGAACVAACSGAASAAFCDLPCGGDADCAVLGPGARCQSGYCRSSGDGGVANACPATTLAAGDTERTVVVGDTTRRYLVHVPASYAGTSPVPLVLDFHPLAGTPTIAANSSGYRELGEQEGFVVAWPEGIDQAWNIGPCCTTSRTVDDLGFARALVQQLEHDACIDVKRIYAVGAVMGGGMAYHLACNAADVFAAIAPSEFDLLAESEEPCHPVRPVAEISFRGTADPLVPYDGGTVSPPNGLPVTMTMLGAVGTFQRWAELDQCTGSPSAEDSNGCSTYSSCAGGVEVTLCTTQGGGMSWGPADLGWAVLKRHPMP